MILSDESKEYDEGSNEATALERTKFTSVT